MGEDTAIAWTDFSFNPWLGCTRVSEGCRACYAETLTKNKMGLDVWGLQATRKVTAQSTWNKVNALNKRAKAEGIPKRVFCASLCDVFEDHPVANATRQKLWELIRDTPWLQWQLLTKRPERIVECLPKDWGLEGWPHVWLGTSIEDMRVVERADILAKIPAVVRFISFEPTLNALDLRPWFGYKETDETQNEYRGLCVSCGYQWDTDYRPGGSNLAGQSSGGKLNRALPPGSMDDQGQASPRAGASAGVSALQGTNPARDADRPRKQPEHGQSTGQSQAAHGLGQPQAPAQFQPSRPTESSVQIDRCPRCGDSSTALQRGDADFYRDGVWRQLPAHFKYRKPSPPLLDWVISGGESGPGFRPEDKNWARTMKVDCDKSGVSYFHKQSAAWRTELGIELDGQIVRAYPIPRIPASSRDLLLT